MREMEEDLCQLSRAFGLDLAGPAAGAAAAPLRALACDVKDLGDSLQVVADCPGVAKEDLKVREQREQCPCRCCVQRCPQVARACSGRSGCASQLRSCGSAPHPVVLRTGSQC